MGPFFLTPALAAKFDDGRAMPLRKKDLKLTLPGLTDGLLRAIGHIITQWAYFEVNIDEELRQLGADVAILRLSTQKRLTAWRDLSLQAYKVNAKHVKWVHKIYGMATRLKPSRDAASHGQWAYGRKSRTTLFRRRYGQIISIDNKLNAARDLEQVARELSEMNAIHFWLQDETLNVREPPL